MLLLADDAAHLLLRTTVLCQHGYECLPASTVDEANDLLDSADIAVLDDYIGEGTFGTEVASRLRMRRPAVPVLVLSATLEHRLGGPEDMHLRRGYNSVDDLLSALQSLRDKRRGSLVVVDARELYDSRIAMAIGADVLVQVLHPEANWRCVNESAAVDLGRPRDWFEGQNLFADIESIVRDWREVLRTVALTRGTDSDRTRRGLLQRVREGEQDVTCSVLAFPIVLHGGENGAGLSARVLA